MPTDRPMIVSEQSARQSIHCGLGCAKRDTLNTQVRRRRLQIRTLTSSAYKAPCIRRCAAGSSVSASMAMRLLSMDWSTTPTQYSTISVRRFQLAMVRSETVSDSGRTSQTITHRPAPSKSACTPHLLRCPCLPSPVYPYHGIGRLFDSSAS